MNKSKFLRKSLALLLSVLMVVAMIPVGASAAGTTTALDVIRINDSTAVAANNTFKADIAQTDVSVRVWVQNIDTTTQKVVVIDKDDTETSVTAEATLNLSKFEKSGSTYSIPMELRKSDETVIAKYTIQLNVVTSATTTNIANVASDNALKSSVNGKTINMVVPTGFTSGNLYVKTADMATVTKNGTAVSTVSSGTYTGWYELTNIGEGSTFKVVSESGKNTATYTIKVNETPVLTSVKFGDVEATLVHEKADKTVYPTGRSITATYPKSVLVVPKTETLAPVKSLLATFSAPADATVSVTLGGTTTSLTTGVTKVDMTDAFDSTVSTKKITVVYKGTTTDYDLAFETVKDAGNTIVSATIDDETAVVSSNTISANLQKNASGAVDVALKTAQTATVTAAVKISGTAITVTSPTAADADEDGNADHKFSADVTDLQKGVIVTVTSEAGENKNYELKVTKTGDVDNTTLTAFALRIGTETYNGTVSGRTVTVTVPYLTTDTELANADVIATCNAYVKAASNSTGTKITKASALGLTSFDLTSKGTVGVETGEVYAVAKSGSAPSTKYDITVKLATPQAGNTLNKFVLTSSQTYKGAKSENTWTGYKTAKTSNTSDLDVTISHSAYNASTATNLYIESIETVNGGVAFYKKGSAALAVASDLVLDKDTTVSAGTALMTKNDTVQIIVLPEVEARKELQAAGSANTAKGHTYTLNIKEGEAKKGNTLSNLKFGDYTLNSTLSGSVSYGLTAAAATDLTKAMFAEFTVSELATLKAEYTNSGTKVACFKSAGGEDATSATHAAADNAKFLLVRDEDNKVVLYVTVDDTNAYAVDRLYVTSESGDDDNKGLPTITYAAANTEAKITAFAVSGVAGSIKAEGNENWTISVNVPVGTKVTSLVPTFTASAGATVKNGSTTLKSGETAVDFTSDVVLSVVSEDAGKVSTYTVKVTVSDSFSDVKETDWFYNNVMNAYNAGLCSGYPDGSFAPQAKITRRDTAIMIYKMMGSPAVTSTTSFVDVAADDYGAAAIAYLKESDIVSGYEDGTFAPAKQITRQEVASMLASALGLSGASDNLFNDDASISNWAKPAVYACRTAGVFNGDNNGNFKAQDYITRAELATAVYQASSL